MPTAEQFVQLQDINARINEFPYIAHSQLGDGDDVWRNIPVSGGDWVCRDYVLAKADALLEDWQTSNLTIVICLTERFGNPFERVWHAVLAVDTGDATMILDNRADNIYEWDQCPFDYRWRRRQIPGTDQALDINYLNGDKPDNIDPPPNVAV